MANGKTHLLAGAGVAIAADVFWQRSQMAADPERKFDWGELLLVGSCGAAFGILADILEPAVHPHHRGFFHSVGFIAILFWAITKIGAKLTAFAFAFSAIMVMSYLSHLFLDCLTPRSLPFIGRWRCW